jgi:hypothetical protein
MVWAVKKPTIQPFRRAGMYQRIAAVASKRIASLSRSTGYLGDS